MGTGNFSLSLYIIAFPPVSVKCSDQCQALWPGPPVTLLAEKYLMLRKCYKAVSLLPNCDSSNPHTKSLSLWQAGAGDNDLRDNVHTPHCCSCSQSLIWRCLHDSFHVTRTMLSLWCWFLWFWVVYVTHMFPLLIKMPCSPISVYSFQSTGPLETGMWSSWKS